MGKVDIAAHQIELSPYLPNRQLPAFLQQQNILAASCMTLACGKLLQDLVLAEMAAKQQATVCRWHWFCLFPRWGMVGMVVSSAE